MSEAQVVEARRSLERVQNFDAKVLPQIEKLGADLSFAEAVAPAERIISLFAQSRPSTLTSCPTR
ncbi:hypothetical protein ACFQU2_03560 [Siccirubricoccus deserti]